jgi:hypothetical protein
MKKLLPILLIMIGIGAGGAAGFVLRPEPEPVGEEMVDGEVKAEEKVVEEPPLDLDNVEFVKLNNQFVVPVVEDNRVASLVVLSISLETAPENTEMIYAREPKIRDEFLRVLFDHAYTGGFSGAFTASPSLDSLVAQLLTVAKKITKNSVSDVLITDILRQDN